MGAQDLLPKPRWSHWSSRDGGDSTKSPSLGPSIAGFALSQACSPTSQVWRDSICALAKVRGWVEVGMGWDGWDKEFGVCLLYS